MSVKRDYKSNTNSWQKKRRQVRRYGLLVMTLALVTVFGSFLAYISGDKGGKDRPVAAAPTPTPAPKQAAPASIQIPEASKPKYDFYKVLPERQVEIPNEARAERAPKPVRPPPPPKPKPVAKPEPKPKPSAPATTVAKTQPKPVAPKPVPKPKTGYVVQAGSFSQYADADRIKASLALMGVSARIEVATGANGKKLHRVRVGPMAGFKQAEKVRQRLRNNNIQAITLKTN